MGHSFTKSFFHCVFSTKDRRNLIPADLQPGLWRYIGGIARTNKFTALTVGGTSDHVHVLLSIPATMPLAKAVQLIKAGSSKWLRQTFALLHGFGWQEGYGAFSIGVSQVDDTIRYIASQAEHHRTRGFEQEFRSFLSRHAIAIDEPPGQD